MGGWRDLTTVGLLPQHDPPGLKTLVPGLTPWTWFAEPWSFSDPSVALELSEPRPFGIVVISSPLYIVAAPGGRRHTLFGLDFGPKT
jgi:hypothetical protein